MNPHAQRFLEAVGIAPTARPDPPKSAYKPHSPEFEACVLRACGWYELIEGLWEREEHRERAFPTSVAIEAELFWRQQAREMLLLLPGGLA